MTLVSCGGSSNNESPAIPVNSRETVSLSAKNYDKYIAVYADSDTVSDGYATGYYRYHLVGSNLCKFNDCKLTYTFVNQQGEEYEDKYTMNLTISGCGESKEVALSYRNNGKQTAYYIFKVLSASGTVEILY